MAQPCSRVAQVLCLSSAVLGVEPLQVCRDWVNAQSSHTSDPSCPVRARCYKWSWCHPPPENEKPLEQSTPGDHILCIDPVFARFVSHISPSPVYKNNFAHSYYYIACSHWKRSRTVSALPLSRPTYDKIHSWTLWHMIRTFASALIFFRLLECNY